MAKKILKFVIGAVVATAIAGAWSYYEMSTKPANESLHARLREAAKRDPLVQELYSKSTADGTLSVLDAWEIASAVEERDGK